MEREEHGEKNMVMINFSFHFSVGDVVGKFVDGVKTFSEL